MEPKFPNVSVQLSGEDGNAFNVIGRVVRALKRAGEPEAAEAFSKAAFASRSYDEVLRLALATVDVS